MNSIVNSERQIDFTISIMLRTNQGIFKPTHESFEFRFCAESAAMAVMLASSNVKSKGFPYDEKIAQITNAIPVFKPILSDECQDQEHDECFFAWCGCSHHQFELPPLVGAPLRSCSEVMSEQDEAEYVEREEALEVV